MLSTLMNLLVDRVVQPVSQIHLVYLDKFIPEPTNHSKK